MARKPTLERRVLDLLWEGGEHTVRDVHDQIDDGLAYTTIATVLARLHGKGSVAREKVDGTWRYRAARSREDALAAEVGRVLDRADGASTEPLLVAFLDRVEALDPAALDRLADLIRDRREEG